MNLNKNTCCSYCGSKFTEQIIYPRKCFNCYNDTFSNPSPVVVAIIRVWDNNRIGVLVQRRAIEPQKGGWAFSGGYMENRETWQAATAREVFEEIGLETQPDAYNLMEIITAPTSGNLLIFSRLSVVIPEGQIKFVPNHEVSEIKIVHRSNLIDLAFPSHTEFLRKELNVRP